MTEMLNLNDLISQSKSYISCNMEVREIAFIEKPLKVFKHKYSHSFRRGCAAIREHQDGNSRLPYIFIFNML